MMRDIAGGGSPLDDRRRNLNFCPDEKKEICEAN
jgi:hypothetical protein